MADFKPMEKVWLDFTGAQVARDLTDEITVKLHDTLLDHLLRKSVVTLQDLEEAGMPNVTLRLLTVQFLFEGYRDGIHLLCDAIRNIAKSDTGGTPQDRLRLISPAVFAGSTHCSAARSRPAPTNGWVANWPSVSLRGGTLPPWHETRADAGRPGTATVGLVGKPPSSVYCGPRFGQSGAARTLPGS